MRKDSVPASRWVATNPFSVLARMLDGMQSLALPALISKGARPPSTTRRSSKSTRIVSNPTPIGSISHPMADWKAAIVAESKGRRKHKIFDEIAEDLEEGWHEMRYATRRESKERWCVALSVVMVARR